MSKRQNNSVLAIPSSSEKRERPACESRRNSPAGRPWYGHRLKTKLRTSDVMRVLGCGLIFLGFATSLRANNVPREYEIKTAFVYNFTKYVEWPANRFPDNASPIVIGVAGTPALLAEFEKIVRDRKVNGRCLSILAVKSAADTDAVHVLFVSASSERQLDLDAVLQRRWVLTVGESERFVAAGGSVNFTMAGDKVRFEINLGAVEQAELKLSSQLLKLAEVVRRKL